MIISRQNLSDIIRYSSVIFDHSRIVNDNRTRELVVLDDGNVKEQDFVCTWSDSTCDKCQYQRDEFEDKVSKQEEIDNGNIEDVRVIKEDSSNLISNVNASVATFIVNGLNGILKFGIKLIDGITN